MGGVALSTAQQDNGDAERRSLFNVQSQVLLQHRRFKHNLGTGVADLPMAYLLEIDRFCRALEIISTATLHSSSPVLILGDEQQGWSTWFSVCSPSGENLSATTAVESRPNKVNCTGDYTDTQRRASILDDRIARFCGVPLVHVSPDRAVRVRRDAAAADQSFRSQRRPRQPPLERGHDTAFIREQMLDAVTDRSLSIACHAALEQSLCQQDDEVEQLWRDFEQLIPAACTGFHPVAKPTVRWILRWLDRRSLHIIRTEGTKRDQARVNACKLKGGAVWMHCPRHRFPNPQFTIAMNIFFGVSIASHPFACVKCGVHSDIKGTHSLSCPNGPNRIRRHNRVQRELAMIGAEAGFAVSIEQQFEDGSELDRAGILVADQQAVADGHEARVRARYEREAEGRPGDVKLEDYFTSDGVADTAAYIDVTVVSPFVITAIDSAAGSLHDLLQTRERDKRRKYANHPCYIPFALNFTGGLGADARNVLRRLADNMAQSSKRRYSEEVHRLYCRISAVLMREQADMILSSVPVHDRRVQMVRRLYGL